MSINELEKKSKIFIWGGVISESISNDILPQIEILNTGIPILMHFVVHVAKLFPTVYRRIYCRRCRVKKSSALENNIMA